MDRDVIAFEIDLTVDFDDSEARRVRRYVRDVVGGLELRGDSSFVETEPHAAAQVYLVSPRDCMWGSPTSATKTRQSRT